MLIKSHLLALLFAFSSSFLSVSAHLTSRDAPDHPCSCADVPSDAGNITQYAPIPDSALGVNISASTTGYVTEHIGRGAYGSSEIIFLQPSSLTKSAI